MRYLWMGLGWLSLGLGVVGAFLPLLPTTPFLLLAAFAFSRGSDRLHDWLVTHPQFGPPIRDWHQGGYIARRVKWVATASVAAVFGLSVVMGVPLWALGTQAVILTFVMFFLWTRPEPPTETPSSTNTQQETQHD